MKGHGDGHPEARLPAGRTSRGPLRSAVGTPVSTASITVVVGFLALLACLLVLGLLAQAIRDKELNALDSFATPFLHGLASPALDRLMNAATFVGSNLVIGPLFAVAVAWLVWRHRPREWLFLAIAIGGSFVLNETMKLFFQRPRPQLAWAQVLPDYSFPSGHTMNSLAFFVALALVLWSLYGRRVGLACLATAIFLTLLIGVSRIYLGYHYLTDVAGGLLAGTAWLLVVGAAFRVGPLSRLGLKVSPDVSRRGEPPRST
jgi:undecaprenyl-diphosphatase